MEIFEELNFEKISVDESSHLTFWNKSNLVNGFKIDVEITIVVVKGIDPLKNFICVNFSVCFEGKSFSRSRRSTSVISKALANDETEMGLLLACDSNSVNVTSISIPLIAGGGFPKIEQL